MNQIIVSAAANEKLFHWYGSQDWNDNHVDILVSFYMNIRHSQLFHVIKSTMYYFINLVIIFYSNWQYLENVGIHHFSSNYSIPIYQKEDCHASEIGDWSNADFINKCSERLFLCCTSRAILYYPLLKWHKTYIPSIIWCVKRKLSKQLHYMHKMFLQNHKICKCRKLWLHCRCSHIIRGYYFWKILRKVL